MASRVLKGLLTLLPAAGWLACQAFLMSGEVVLLAAWHGVWRVAGQIVSSVFLSFDFFGVRGDEAECYSRWTVAPWVAQEAGGDIFSSTYWCFRNGF